MDRSTAANNLTRLAMVEYTAHELEFIKLLVGDIVTEDDKQVCRLDVAKNEKFWLTFPLSLD